MYLFINIQVHFYLQKPLKFFKNLNLLQFYFNLKLKLIGYLIF